MLSKKTIVAAAFLLAVGGTGLYGVLQATPPEPPREAYNEEMEALLQQEETPSPLPVEALPKAVGDSEDDGKKEAPAAAADGMLDLNTATLEQLLTLPGIGESKGKAILELRSKLGAFQSVEQLKDVKGIGDKVFEKLRPFVKAGSS
ncbi:ComEA family DNA-binding protein [Paenibacillus chartarius]|uniref:ComEA family DNA-binding protein n=1 Tax=Paenibacillus chartarius TaxID=747481 RepID=A0ABV6DT60_9BACL